MHFHLTFEFRCYLDLFSAPTYVVQYGVYKTATLMFKVKQSLVPVNISDSFNFKDTRYNLRNSDFELPRFEMIKLARNSIKYMGALIWSKLPRHLRMSEILNLFKRNIRKVDISTLVNI